MAVAFVFRGHLGVDRIWVSRGESGAIQGFTEEIKEEMPMGGVGNARPEK